jgi:hypothetical protein
MNSIRHHRVVDGVIAYEQHAVSVTHVVPLHPNLGIIRKLPDAAVRLELAPLLERVSPDVDKIALS